MQFLGTGPTGGWGVNVFPLLRHPHGRLACVGMGLSLWPSPRLPHRSREGGLGGGLVEVVVLEVLERRGGLQLIDTHVVSHVASR